MQLRGQGVVADAKATEAKKPASDRRDPKNIENIKQQILLAGEFIRQINESLGLLKG